jgi:hypothetical protein
MPQNFAKKNAKFCATNQKQQQIPRRCSSLRDEQTAPRNDNEKLPA